MGIYRASPYRASDGWVVEEKPHLESLGMSPTAPHCLRTSPGLLTIIKAELVSEQSPQLVTVKTAP